MEMPAIRKPSWMKKYLFKHSKNEESIKKLISKSGLHTVCREARCPNIGECFSRGTATFLLLGNICTRNCRFCNISNDGRPAAVDINEPARTAGAVKELGLKYAVLTSVTRDDLPDGGASIFAETVKEIKKISESTKIEVLVPDFEGKKSSIDIVISSDISVFNHNLETVKRLYPSVRPMADYFRSLEVLEYAKQNSGLTIKTGIMVGLGENSAEVEELMQDFYRIGGDILTIGQYLSPGKDFYPVKEFIKPRLFEKYKKTGEKLGIKAVFSGPFVRSSYLSENIFFNINLI
jgi:lipoyl synthase